MWTKMFETTKPLYAINNRKYAWKCWYTERGGAIVELCEVDSEGWIIYELYEAAWDHRGIYRYWGERFLLVTNGDVPVETYSLTPDEFFDHRNMTPNWAVPF